MQGITATSCVKLLSDENLSPKLTRLLCDLYPNSTHVRDVGLARADDDVVWEYAAWSTLELDATRRAARARRLATNRAASCGRCTSTSGVAA
jgi:hypothetical protein